MCGIAGFYNTKLSREEGTALLAKMLPATRHRGPDYTGTEVIPPAFLGHNRLSIIDLSDSANQPMTYMGLKMVFNGEVYNYLEIKKELLQLGYTFKTESDTEVIIAAYRQWGKDCVLRFIGMWAFAIWEESTHTLFCSRDRFGIKPFYYIHAGEALYFASEYKPLKLVPEFNASLNLAQVSRALQLGWLVYNDQSFFDCIRVLPPAHNLILTNGKLNTYRYWDIDFSKSNPDPLEQQCNDFRQLLKHSITLHLRSDVPVAATLSGGIDSSVIVSEIATMYPEQRLKTFTVYYEGKYGVDERPFANEVIHKYRKNLTPYYYSPSDGEITEHFHRALYHSDVPVTGSSFFSQYFIMKSIADQKIKVVLSGQGADDYLGGYMHSFYRLYADYIRQFKWGKLLTDMMRHKKNQEWGVAKSIDIFAKSMLSAIRDENTLYRLEYTRYLPFLSVSSKEKDTFVLENKGNTRLNAFLYQLMFNTSLPTLLHYEDRNSMAFSIESRVPFLDHRLVEFAFATRNSAKINGPVTKYLLREATKDVLPQAIYARKDKKGFVTPGEVKWLRGPLRHLLDIDWNLLDMIDRVKAQKVVNDFKNGDNKNANLVWRLATLHYWVKNIA